MSGYPYDHVPSPLPGAHRPSANPRLHTVAKPYSRPASYSGPTPAEPSSQLMNGHGRDPSPVKAAQRSTRSHLPTSSSSSSLPRSGSDTSLLSGLKSIFSRPLQWLATPSRAAFESGGTKRDSYSSFGVDMEDPDSPSDRREGKRQRRVSPHPEGDYAPKPLQVQGRAVTGFMLPPLPPHVTLEARSHHPNDKPLPNRTNFSRPLNMPTSKSMPYLDPPSGVLASPARRGLGAMTRSRRMELGDMGDEEDQMSGQKAVGKGKDREEIWTLRSEMQTGARRAMTPTRAASARIPETREYTLPSLSPFRPAPSPSHTQHMTPLSSLARSNTIGNVRRASSIISDISMGRESPSGVKRSMSMLFGQPNGVRHVEDERMSVDGDRQRDGRESSALDWFMRDRWGSREPGSPASRAASMRLGSVGPSAGMPPIRKGQLVWDPDKGFVRESELKAAEVPQPVHQNDAERILFALEAMRKTPLADARKSSTFASSSDSLPPELVGSSSRQLRKAISVPLATAQSGESAKQRRDRERLGEKNVSVMISPYGRRRQVDGALRDARREERRTDDDSDYGYSRSPTYSSEGRTERSSQASDQDMRSEREATPPPATAPRRSTRIKRADPLGSEVTPKAKKTRSKAGAPTKKAAGETPTPKETPRRTRRATAEKGTSPEPPRPTPAIPTITETAPSPGQITNGRTTTQGDIYKPRADGDAPRGSSSLRARSELTKRTHGGAASYNNSRAASPSTGRYSANEDDLPPMEELEQAKIALSSLSGITFGLGTASSAETKAASTTTGSDLLSRIAPAPVPPVQQASHLGVPSPSRASGDHVSRLSAGLSNRPRASSPLASGFITAESDSPPEAPHSTAQGTASTINETVSQPPSGGFFPLSTTTQTATATSSGNPTSSLFANLADNSAAGPKKSLVFGNGKPSATVALTEKKDVGPSGIPDFFGTKSATSSGSSTPIPPTSHFNFGLSAKPAEGPTSNTAPSFSFGAPSAQSGSDSSNIGQTPKIAESPAATPFSFGPPKSAETAPAAASVSFGAAKSAEASKPAFSFPSASPAPADTSAGPSKSTFSFGAPTEPPKPADQAPKPSFSFGTTNTNAPTAVSQPAEESAKPAFTFGASSPALQAPTPAASGSPFGGSFSNKPSEPAKDTPPVSGGFTFGSNGGSSPFGGTKQTNGTTEAPQSNPFNAGGPSSAPASTPHQFTFGAPPQANGNSGSAGGGFSAPALSTSAAFGFGAQAAPAPVANPFSSGPPPPTASTPFTFGGSNASAPVQNSNPFAPAPSQPAAPTNSFSFGFGGTPNPAPAPTPPTPSFNFGSTNPNPPAPAASNPFGTSTPQSQQAFTFGQAQPPSTTPQGAPPAFGFGMPPQPRFGSPVPPGSPAEGGFSLGMSPDAQAPGSPSGRKIKPLRRGAVKR